MKDIALLIKKFREKGIGLSLSGENLEVSLFEEEIEEEVLKKLKEKKEEIKVYLKGLSSISDFRGIPSIPLAASYELSSAQRRLWVLSQFEEGSMAYNLPLHFELQGDYDVDLLEKAMAKVIDRHEILRTVFKLDEAENIQQWIVPQEEVNFKIDFQDFQQVDHQKEALEQYIAEDAYRLFDLKNGPLLRVSLLQLATDRFVLYYNMHHIISDAWSIELLSKEVFACYQAYKTGEEPVLPALAIQYKDYAAWQTAQFVSEDFKAHQAFWNAQLSGTLPLLDLPSHSLRPALKTNNGQTFQTYLPKELSTNIRQFSQQQEGSLFMTLLSTWYILFYRYTEQKDLIIGTPVAGREHSDLQNQIGFYLNTLALRQQVNPTERFVDFYEKVKAATLNGFKHQAYPFDRLIEDLQVKRNMSRNAVFDVMFTVQNAGQKRTDHAVNDAMCGPLVETDLQTSKFDIDIVFQEVGDYLSFTLNFNNDVYDREMITRLMNHYQQLLTILVAEPQQTIGSVNFLSSEETQQLLHRFNATQGTYPKDKTVIDLFSSQAKNNPEKVALVFGETELTYRELEEVSSQLAHYLNQTCELQADDLIGIQLERSEWLLIAMLGVLKSGAAYVPIDPGYPEERTAYVKKESRCQVCIDQDFIRIFQQEKVTCDKTFVSPNIDPEKLAYVIFTSGSTGKPKGVMIEHRNLMNFIGGMDEALSLDSSNHLLALTSVSFDISILELLYTISKGILVTIKRDDTALSSFDQFIYSKSKHLDFSLLFFSSQKTQADNKYQLLFDTVKYADQHDFSAVWLPERHFHEFGGIFPNPSVLGAALASVTEKINLRSGSVVLPLHDTIRVAEEWSVVDNISNGRVSLSIASGWHSNDFVLQQERYKNRHASMFTQIEDLKKLWRGEEVERVNGVGETIKVTTFPRPIQPELPIWVTSGGNVETFKKAGKIGANVLTHLLGQDIDLLKSNVLAYREALRENGHSVEKAKISLMLHTYIGEDLEEVKEIVREPFKEYLKSSLGLIKNMMKEFSENADSIEGEDLANLLDLAFERYWQTSALLGTKESCNRMVEVLRLIGVTELACLIDFGLEQEHVMKGLDHLNDLRATFHQPEVKLKSKDQPIDTMQITPSYLKALADDEYSFNFFQSLKNLIVGGETFPQELAKQLAGKTQAAISNMYGPTETTIWSTTQSISAEEGITVGKPIQNTQVYIVDPHFNLCPIGVVGHLYIGGDGVARGYLNQPKLSAERFIANPFDEQNASRIYHTGDIARWLPDGRIELLGRSDNQVKVNGYRIELEEIENALLQHSSVANAAVIVGTDEEQHKMLQAFIVAKGKLQTNDLRDHLAAQLPHYMIPANFMELDAIPLTANGKINRRALAAMDAVAINTGTIYVEPTNKIEEKLVTIWSELLGLEKEAIGIENNFFDLGGNSILAIKLLSVVNKSFDAPITLVNLYSESTIYKLAQFLSGKAKASQEEEENLDELADTMEMAFNNLVDIEEDLV